nr:MAG TPA: hypothetical protein [Caudoviricetes sp.]
MKFCKLLILKKSMVDIMISDVGLRIAQIRFYKRQWN